MQVTNGDIDNLLGPYPHHKFDKIRFMLAQGLLRVQAGLNVPYQTLTNLQELQLIGDNGIVKKGTVFLFEQLSVNPA